MIAQGMIEEALKNNGLVLKTGDNTRWIVWYIDQWIVCEHRYNAKKVTHLAETDDLKEALRILIGEGD